MKTKLFCAIAGDSGAAFPVKIDSDEYVGDLKIAIKDDNNDIKVPARALRLFLARKDKGEGDWLTGEEAAAVRCDDLGCFKLLNPLLFLKNPENFGENFQRGENQVHVLVKLPADFASIGPNVGLPRTTALNEPEKYAEEYISLDDWMLTLCKIPLI
ncbi:hypothetical protein V7S43_004382 [Phytophthora oleae]|uniref:Crinkler effector protein N-terminal domain-containing protein n=1 Tax=Phytophthora oleae TaxID=2107226 RepID=A0ABD3FUT3_9STRA